MPQEKQWWPEEVKVALEQVFGEGSVLSVPMSFSHSKNRATHAKSVEMKLSSPELARDMYHRFRAIHIMQRMPEVAGELSALVEQCPSFPNASKEWDAFCDRASEFGLKDPIELAGMLKYFARFDIKGKSFPEVQYNAFRPGVLMLAFSPDVAIRGEQVRHLCQQERSITGKIKDAKKHFSAVAAGNAASAPVEPEALSVQCEPRPQASWVKIVTEYEEEARERSAVPSR